MQQPISSRQREASFRANRPKGAVDKQPADTHPNGQGKPPAPKKSKQERKRYLKAYVGWLWPYRWAMSAVFLLAVVTAALDMVWPLAIRHIIDGILLHPALQVNQKMRALALTGGGVAVLLVIKQALDSLRSYRISVLNAKVIFRLRQRLFDHFLSLPLGHLGDMKSGGITSRLSGDIDSVMGLVQNALISPGVAAIRVMLTILILTFLSWRLAVAALLVIPPLAVLSFLWLRRVRPIYRTIRDDTNNVDARVNETFGGIRVVRSFRREPRERHAYGVDHHTIIRKGLFAQRLELALEFIWGLLIPGTTLAIVWYGGYLVLRGAPGAGVGNIFAFQIYAVLLLQPVWQIVASVSQTQKSLAAMERVFETFDISPDKPDVPDAIAAPPVVREIRFDSVNFQYRPDVPVIRDFSLSVPGGSVVALVGPSGAGKTTLTDLVARFHDPTSGAILLNGIDLRNYRLANYRKLLAVVQQETFLFDGTVRENIAYGRRSATDEQVRDAARRANAGGFISQLPQAYDTLIGERGFKLSGGQRQRLSIARAILADPQILLLDEATSNLDTESEQLIQTALDELLHHRTTFVIAHRLSTVANADLIVVLDEGQIRETGTHEELLARRGMYYDMVERQRRSFGDVSATFGSFG